jgi:nitroreductase
MDALDAIHGRRSIRRFRPEAIAEDTLETLLRAAMAAPSAGNQQPWRFIVVRDRAIREELSRKSPYASMLPGAALGIAVCGDLSAEKHKGYWVQDCSAAVQNLLVAAHAIGLGAVWLGYYPDEERWKGAQEVLRLPKEIVPLCVIAVGYPEEAKPPADRYDPGKVRTDFW